MGLIKQLRESEPFNLLPENLFEELRASSHDGVGITRETYASGETQAMRRLRRYLRMRRSLYMAGTRHEGTQALRHEGRDKAGRE